MEDTIRERNTVLQNLLWKRAVSMSELKEYIEEQLNDPEFKKEWEVTNMGNSVLMHKNIPVIKMELDELEGITRILSVIAENYLN